MPESVAELAKAVRGLSEEYKETAEAMREVGREMDRRLRVQRLWMATLAAVVLLAIIVGFGFRQQDRSAEDERAASVAREAVFQRKNLVQGCERANDQRATLREVINLSVRTMPVPEGLDPDLVPLFEQGQARTAALRDRLLALPGVQPVDCQAAYPVTDGQ